jgi:hypothetical protein
MWRYFRGAAVKTFNRLGLAIVCAAALSAMVPASSRADTIYTYTGNGFASAISPYTSTDLVSGWIDLLEPLGISVGPLTITPVSFSFSDGVQTITNNNYNVASFSFNDFVTSSSGGIVWWYVELFGVPNGGIHTYNSPLYSSYGDYAAGAGGYAVNYSAPGTWEVTTTPIPAALPLFATGLGALGLLGWRRKRKAQAS